MKWHARRKHYKSNIEEKWNDKRLNPVKKRNRYLYEDYKDYTDREGYGKIFSPTERGTSKAVSQATIFARYMLQRGETFRFPARPPKGLLVDMLTPPAHAEEALANISARYDHWVAKYGKRRANQIFYAQCLGVVATFWADWAMKRLKLLKLMRLSG